MSAAKKLQGEIDKVMKKVDEGIVVFEDIWEKVRTEWTPVEIAVYSFLFSFFSLFMECAIFFHGHM